MEMCDICPFSHSMFMRFTYYRIYQIFIFLWLNYIPLYVSVYDYVCVYGMVCGREVWRLPVYDCVQVSFSLLRGLRLNISYFISHLDIFLKTAC